MAELQKVKRKLSTDGRPPRTNENGECVYKRIGLLMWILS